MTFGSIALVALMFCAAVPAADDHDAPPEELHLPALGLEFLRAEMRQHTQVIRSLTDALVIGDWTSIADGAARIRPAYFVDKAQPATLRKDIETRLSADFVRQYRDLHARAEGLRAAAARQDPQATNFQFFRLLESCVECHAQYAPERFAGLAGKGHGQHRD